MSRRKNGFDELTDESTDTDINQEDNESSGNNE